MFQNIIPIIYFLKEMHNLIQPLQQDHCFEYHKNHIGLIVARGELEGNLSHLALYIQHYSTFTALVL
jgi:hypothetical protein